MRESKRYNGAKGKTTARTGVSLATVILLAEFLLFTTLPADLASPDWSDPDWIFTLSGSTEYAFIAVDSAGTAHVVWFEWDVGESWYNAGTPGDWPDPELLSTHSDYWQEDPRLALDPDDNVHVVWEGYDADGYDWLIWYADNAGGAWSTPENISPDDSSPYSPNIAVDSVGAAHVVFHGHNETHGGDCSVVYATNAGGDWSYPVLLSGDHGHNGSWLPWIAVDPFDHPHVVSDGDDEDIWYTANLGSGWSEPLSLSTQSTYEQGAPQIAVDINGNPHAAWHGYGSVDDYYQIWYSADISQCIVRAAVEGGHGMVDPEMQAVPVGGTAVIALLSLIHL